MKKAKIMLDFDPDRRPDSIKVQGPPDAGAHLDAICFAFLAIVPAYCRQTGKSPQEVCKRLKQFINTIPGRVSIESNRPDLLKPTKIIGGGFTA